MKITVMSKAAFIFVQALTLCASLQGETQAIKEGQQVSDLLTTIKTEDKRAVIQFLYAHNTQVDLTSTVVVIPAGQTVGDSIPFNNGTTIFPPEPLYRGKAIRQLDDTHFLIFQNGDYLVTFYGYKDNEPAGVGAQLFVNTLPTGPATIAADGEGLISFSQVIRITDACHTSPALLEVKAVSAAPNLGNLVLQSPQYDGVNATLEIVKLDL